MRSLLMFGLAVAGATALWLLASLVDAIVMLPEYVFSYMSGLAVVTFMFIYWAGMVVWKFRE